MKPRLFAILKSRTAKASPDASVTLWAFIMTMPAMCCPCMRAFSMSTTKILVVTNKQGLLLYKSILPAAETSFVTSKGMSSSGSGAAVFAFGCVSASEEDSAAWVMEAVAASVGGTWLIRCNSRYSMLRCQSVQPSTKITPCCDASLQASAHKACHKLQSPLPGISISTQGRGDQMPWPSKPSSLHVQPEDDCHSFLPTHACGHDAHPVLRDELLHHLRPMKHCRSP